MINEESSLAYVLSPAVQVMQSSFEQQVNDQVSNGRAAIIQLNNGDISLMTEEKSQHLSVSFEKVQNKQSVPQNKRTTQYGIVQAVSVEQPTAFPCTMCTEVFNNNSLLKKHAKEEHRWDFECDVCALYFRTQKMLEEHKKAHEKKQSKQAKILENFEVILENGQPMKYRCLTCTKILRSKHNLMTHINNHIGYEKTLCPKCPSSFRNKELLERHMLRFHNNQPPTKKPRRDAAKIQNFHDESDEEVMQSSFEQQVNDQVSNGRAAIIQLNNGDISLMTEEKSQHLSVSFEKVQNKQSVPQNKRTTQYGIVQAVSVEQPTAFPCTMCTEVFNNNSLLKKHAKEEHRWDFECDVCALYFRTQKMLEEHKKAHEKKQSKQAKILENFEVILENGQPMKYRCLTCTKILRSKHNLMTHINNHIGYEKTLCPKCPSSFRNKELLERHMLRFHNNQPPTKKPRRDAAKIQNFHDESDEEMEAARRFLEMSEKDKNQYS
ncbi:Zinc finger protein [Trichinella pseudospiralis]|uniref:Zinc finger protein n=1 Tax=Trichinella pseudospiralis TaxID=6337 RepID=A0A0V1IH36_TRIPS|nr:Zinc finger protein [Trichinella pseudospiralis]KRZ22033.1 Zinc finger protein [Trichinella pseudospiralis]KRZ36433.1 Zinc finger protein [Trichinella pseudospiralis]